MKKLITSYPSWVMYFDFVANMVLLWFRKKGNHSLSFFSVILSSYILDHPSGLSITYFLSDKRDKKLTIVVFVVSILAFFGSLLIERPVEQIAFSKRVSMGFCCFLASIGLLYFLLRIFRKEGVHYEKTLESELKENGEFDFNGHPNAWNEWNGSGSDYEIYEKNNSSYSCANSKCNKWRCRKVFK